MKDVGEVSNKNWRTADCVHEIYPDVTADQIVQYGIDGILVKQKSVYSCKYDISFAPRGRGETLLATVRQAIDQRIQQELRAMLVTDQTSRQFALPFRETRTAFVCDGTPITLKFQKKSEQIGYVYDAQVVTPEPPAPAPAPEPNPTNPSETLS